MAQSFEVDWVALGANAEPVCPKSKASKAIVEEVLGVEVDTWGVGEPKKSKTALVGCGAAEVLDFLEVRFLPPEEEEGAGIAAEASFWLLGEESMAATLGAEADLFDLLMPVEDFDLLGTESLRADSGVGVEESESSESESSTTLWCILTRFNAVSIWSFTSNSRRTAFSLSMFALISSTILSECARNCVMMGFKRSSGTGALGSSVIENSRLSDSPAASRVEDTLRGMAALETREGEVKM